VRDSELIAVGWAYGQAEAALALGLLNASGIMVFAHSWHVLSVQWHWTHALGGIELRVPVSQAAAALELLDGFQVTPRPRSLLRRLLTGVIFVAALILVNLPPPSAGFFAAARRPVAALAPAPSAGPS